MRVLYFGTYERDYPRNAQVISCLRGAGVEVAERHEPVWEGRRAQVGRPGSAAAARLAAGRAPARCARPRGRLRRAARRLSRATSTCRAARRAAGGRPVVFNPLVSLADTLVADRGRFRPGSLAARALAAIDRRALRAADLVVADTDANADHLAALAGCRAERVEVCLVGAEERALPARLAPARAVHVPLRRQADPAARARDDPRRRAARARAPVPPRRQRPARAAARRPPAERRAGPVGRVRAPAGRAAPAPAARSGSSAPPPRRARDPEQGVPGARLRDAARHRRHARPRASCSSTARARCSSRPATPRRSPRRCAARRGPGARAQL